MAGVCTRGRGQWSSRAQMRASQQARRVAARQGGRLLCLVGVRAGCPGPRHGHAPTSTPSPLAPTTRTRAPARRRIVSRPYTASWRLRGARHTGAREVSPRHALTPNHIPGRRCQAAHAPRSPVQVLVNGFGRVQRHGRSTHGRPLRGMAPAQVAVSTTLASARHTNASAATRSLGAALSSTRTAGRATGPAKGAAVVHVIARRCHPTRGAGSQVP